MQSNDPATHDSKVKKNKKKAKKAKNKQEEDDEDAFLDAFIAENQTWHNKVKSAIFNRRNLISNKTDVNEW